MSVVRVRPGSGRFRGVLPNESPTGARQPGGVDCGLDLSFLIAPESARHEAPTCRSFWRRSKVAVPTQSPSGPSIESIIDLDAPKSRGAWWRDHAQRRPRRGWRPERDCQRRPGLNAQRSAARVRRRSHRSLAVRIQHGCDRFRARLPRHRPDRPGRRLPAWPPGGPASQGGRNKGLAHFSERFPALTTTTSSLSCKPRAVGLSGATAPAGAVILSCATALTVRRRRPPT